MWKFLEPVLDSPWTVWATCVIIYAINCILVCMSDECLKHSYFTCVSLAFSCCFDIIYIVLGVRSLIMCLF